MHFSQYYRNSFSVSTSLPVKSLGVILNSSVHNINHLCSSLTHLTLSISDNHNSLLFALSLKLLYLPLMVQNSAAHIIITTPSFHHSSCIGFRSECDSTKFSKPIHNLALPYYLISRSFSPSSPIRLSASQLSQHHGESSIQPLWSIVLIISLCLNSDSKLT